MSQSQDNNKRIAKNTLLLYFRMLITMFVSLYTSRVVLNTLGVEDYGIYNVVGGIIVILGFLNNAMAGATQRFLNIEIGKKDYVRLKKVFFTSLVIHALVAGIVLVMAETLGLWYLNTCMNIESCRMTAANWVFQFSVATFMVNIISVPYNATIIAHEKMSAFAYISILEVVLKLLIVYLLVLIPFEKLTVYAFLIFVVGVVLILIYGLYCKRHFKECTDLVKELDRPMMKEMLSFSSWTIFGNLGFIAHTQGIALVINYFFGVTVNAASGLANQVNGVVTSFVTNFMTAMNPQVVKTYAAEKYAEMYNLIVRGCQVSFYMLAFFVIPLTIEMPTILKLWLKIVPDYTVIFVRIVLFTSLFGAYSGILATAKGATGQIKAYQLTLTIMGLFHLPLAVFFFWLGYPPYYSMYIYMFIVIIQQVVRIQFVCKSIDLPLARFYKEVIARCLLILALGSIVPLLMHNLLIPSVGSSIIICMSFALVFVPTVMIVGFKKSDRNKILQIISSKIKSL